MFHNLRLSDLHIERDKPVVFAWLRNDLRRRLEAWNTLAEASWSERDIDERLDRNGLVQRAWHGLTAADRDRNAYIVVARDRTRAIGIAHARERVAAPLDVRLGEIAWLFVDPLMRGGGAGSRLVAACHVWMRARQLPVSAVTIHAASNEARNLGRRHGYRTAEERQAVRLSNVDDAAEP